MVSSTSSCMLSNSIEILWSVLIYCHSICLEKFREITVHLSRDGWKRSLSSNYALPEYKSN
jgi:hypothetical protein